MKTIIYAVLAFVGLVLMCNESEFLIWNIVGIGVILTLFFKHETEPIEEPALEAGLRHEELDHYEYDAEQKINKFWYWFLGMLSGIVATTAIGWTLLAASGIL